jgi:hypothetical protein
MKTRAFLLALLVALPVAAATPEAANVYFSAGHNPSNLHGSSDFRSLTFEMTFHEPLLERWARLHDTEAGAAISYHQIHQPRSWFGHTYGDPDDAVRSESLFVFVRHHWRATSDVQPFLDLGTGPMWANRRVPAATSRFNFNSQLGVGVTLFATSRWPLLAGYRFEHISNGGFTGRNPGLDVHTVFFGTTIRVWR